MRFTVLMVSLALATTAVADDKRKPVSVTKEVDKATPMLMSTNATDDATQATGAKETFDRSKPHAAAPRDAASGMATGKRQHGAAPHDEASGMATGRRAHASSSSCTDGMDNDCDGVSDAAPANHNTTRSNRTLRVHQPTGSATGATRSRAQDYNSSRSNNINGEADSGGGGGAGATRAQDYNSSRSNTDGVRLDPDSDGDSLREVRCSVTSDACVDAGNGDDPVLRKRPGR